MQEDTFAEGINIDRTDLTSKQLINNHDRI